MGWYVFNSRACLSPEINRFSRTNSSVRRTESYLMKIKSCCRVVSRFEIVSPSLFEVHTRAYVFDYVGRFSVSDCLRCLGKNDNKENTRAFSNDSHGRRIAINLRRCVVAFLSLKWYRTTIVSCNTSKELKFRFRCRMHQIFYISRHLRLLVRLFRVILFQFPYA